MNLIKKNKKTYIYSFFILLFFYIVLFPFQWTHNEFMYFAMANFYHEDNFSNYSSFHYTLNKYPFGYLHGIFIQLFGYDYTWFFGRLILVPLYFFILLSFIKTFFIRTYILLLSLILFYLLNQNFFFSGEWLIQGFESKVFSYLIFFYSFKLLLKEKLKFFLFLNIISFYIHFQAGFYTFGFLMIFYLIHFKNRRIFFKMLFYYIIFCLPFITILFYENLYFTNTEINTIIAERNYSIISAFNNEGVIKKNFLLGIFLITIFTVLLNIIKLNKFALIQKNSFNSLILTSIIANIYLLFSICVNYLDTNNFFAKFYIYRPSSYMLLIELIIILTYLFKSKKNVIILAFIFFLIITPLLSKKYSFINLSKIVLQRVMDSFSSKITKLTNSEIELIQWVDKNTKSNSVFLIQEIYNHNNINVSAVSFEQNVKRPTLVNFNNSFGSKRDYERWFTLLNKKNNIFKGNCGSSNPDYKYIVFFEKKNLDTFIKKCKFEIVFNNNISTILEKK
jgi:hypothetical protein